MVTPNIAAGTPVLTEVTCIAPVNIAVVKYWGKRDTQRILPSNSSLSVTLDTADLHSKTTVRVLGDAPADEEVEVDGANAADRMWLNDTEEPIAKLPRVQACLREMRARRQAYEKMHGEAVQGLHSRPVHIISENNFPTAAGLASSASGLACLAYSLAQAYELVPVTHDDNDDAINTALTDLSTVARQGSGSACRSLFGGYVKWEMGSAVDGADSVAVQVAPRAHWPEMRAIILVVDDAKKGVSSTAGMQTTVETSALFRERLASVVPERMRQMEQAIATRDFPSFAELTMRDSNQFHAVCLDTYPPISYLNDTSKRIMQLVHAYNGTAPPRVAYTYDAGPNAVLYMLESEVPAFIDYLRPHLPSPASIPCSDAFVAVLDACEERERDVKKQRMEVGDGETTTTTSAVVEPLAIRRVIYTRVGDGPRVVERK